MKSESAAWWEEKTGPGDVAMDVVVVPAFLVCKCMIFCVLPCCGVVIAFVALIGILVIAGFGMADWVD